VSEYISQTSNSLPHHLRVFFPNLIWYMFSGFTNNEQIVEYGINSHFVCDKLLIIETLQVAFNFLCRSQNILQVTYSPQLKLGASTINTRAQANPRLTLVPVGRRCPDAQNVDRRVVVAV